MAITLRSVKLSELTHSELDQNFIDLRDGVNLQVPKTQGKGIMIGPNGTETWGWRDLTAELHIHDADPDAPAATVYRAGIKQHLFQVNDSAQVSFHLPHDYAMGTNIYIHSHWSHNATNVTGGHVTWGFELIYGKGHNQGTFGLPVDIVEQQDASTIQYQHMICEALASTPGGDTNLLDTNQLEVDALIFGRVYLVANNLTISGGGVPDVFLHTVDIHYQSTGVGTKNKAPSFWS